MISLSKTKSERIIDKMENQMETQQKEYESFLVTMLQSKVCKLCEKSVSNEDVKKHLKDRHPVEFLKKYDPENEKYDYCRECKLVVRLVNYKKHVDKCENRKKQKIQNKIEDYHRKIMKTVEDAQFGIEQDEYDKKLNQKIQILNEINILKKKIREQEFEKKLQKLQNILQRDKEFYENSVIQSQISQQNPQSIQWLQQQIDKQEQVLKNILLKEKGEKE